LFFKLSLLVDFYNVSHFLIFWIYGLPFFLSIKDHVGATVSKPCCFSFPFCFFLHVFFKRWDIFTSWNWLCLVKYDCLVLVFFWRVFINWFKISTYFEAWCELNSRFRLVVKFRIHKINRDIYKLIWIFILLIIIIIIIKRFRLVNSYSHMPTN